MRFDRIQAKWNARTIIAHSKPNVCLVTLVYLLATSGLALLLSLFVVNPMQAANQYVMDWAAGGGVGSLTAEEVLAAAYAGSSGVLGVFASVLLGLYQMVMQGGYLFYITRLVRRERGGYADLLEGFGIAGKVVGLNLLIVLYSFLWMLPVTVLFTAVVFLAALSQSMAVLLLVYIAGVVGMVAYAVWVSLRYAMSVYLLMDQPEQGVLWAIRTSVQTMKGWKKDLFVLWISFLGWSLLSAVTGGLAGIWVSPYTSLTIVQFYEFISGRQTISAEEIPPVNGGNGF